MNPLSGTHYIFTEGAVGIIVSITNNRLVKNEINLLSSFNRSIEYLWQTLLISKNAFWGYFSGSTHPQFQGPLTVGPIGIGQITGSIATANVSISDKLVTFINLASILSLSLAIINILPIPGLDGGHVFIALIEGIIQRDLPLNVKYGIQTFGFFLLMTLFVLVFYNDIINLI